jgi:hypothetical protein
VTAAEGSVLVPGRFCEALSLIFWVAVASCCLLVWMAVEAVLVACA